MQIEALAKSHKQTSDDTSGDNIKCPKYPLLCLLEWLSIENVLLFLVCMADMLTTLYWVHKGIAVEANPIFALWLMKGDATFIGMKLLSFMPLIAVSTYYRRTRPRLIMYAMRFTIAIYIILYFGRMLFEMFVLMK